MLIKLKKPGVLRSAFLLALTVPFLGQQAGAVVSCQGQSWSDDISRSEVAGTGSDAAEQAIPLTTTKSGTVVNQVVDLNIQSDLSGMVNNQVTAESVDWVWRLNAENKDKLSGDIVADYQFSSLGGPGTICASSTSCMEIVNIQTNVTYIRQQGNNRILQAEGRVILTLDLQQASLSGNYNANVSITLHHNSSANPSLCP